MKNYIHRLKNTIIIVIITNLFIFTETPVYAEFWQPNRFLHPQSSRTVSMDFKEAALNDVLKIFSQQSGMNFIAADTVSNRKITLFLDKVPVEQALEMILHANNLTYELEPDNNIFIVKTNPQASQRLLTRIYYLKNATVLSSKLNSTITIKDKEEEGEASGDTGTSGAAENSTVDIGILAAIKTVLSESGKVVEDPRTNSLVITDIPSQFPLIEQTINRLDVPIAQVLIEVEMLDISKEAADKLGVKIGDTPLTFTGGERDHVYPWNQNRLLDKGYAFEDAEYRVGTISAAGLSATLQFLKTQSDTKNLARPRILTLSNETAQIKISTNEAIGVSSERSGEGTNLTRTVEAERVETGIFLTVTPQVNVTSEEIIMAISPRVIQAKTGGTFEGVTFKDPEERGTKSILKVLNGDTIILGGLLRTDMSTTKTKVPLFGDVPIMGTAFRHKDKVDKERELVIFITPHIVKNTDDLAQMARTEADEYLLREQDIPTKRQNEIQKALSAIEKKK